MFHWELDICSSFFFWNVIGVDLNFKHSRLILYLATINDSAYLCFGHQPNGIST